jgi:phage baseplate assembly protein V
MSLMAFESADQRIRGAVVGIVTDVNDPDELGRVEIELPWYASGYREWARVSHFYAGPGYGDTWVPEVDGEVLVLFAHGDMRFPFVVGCLYSPVDEPPESRSDSSDVRTILTPKGSELRFDETNQVITLKTQSGASIELDEQSGELTLEATSKITIKAADISIEASNSVKVHGTSIALN